MYRIRRLQTDLDPISGKRGFPGVFFWAKGKPLKDRFLDDDEIDAEKVRMDMIRGTALE